MKTYQFTLTKRRHICHVDGQWLVTNKDYGNREFKAVDEVPPGNMKPDFIVEAESIEDAYYKFVGHLIAASSARKAEKERLMEEKRSKVEELLKLDVIPATPENIRLVLGHLNDQNWGAWDLPRMSVGYRALQYDCEGKTITTITLNEPVHYRGESIRRFKSGRKRGHLEKYHVI